MESKFASRAGEKLQFAITRFGVDLTGKVCADFGCSTGGFVDCLLQGGAKKVYAVDTGYGVLDWRLRNDPRVIVMERTNALHVKLPVKVDFISIDVGWTPQRLILPVALANLVNDGEIVSLLKPHYEAEKSWLRNGRLQDEFVDDTLAKVSSELLQLGINTEQIVESPIVGKKGGNREFLIYVKI